eukprot:6454902-Amphidinium_carterae.2
MILRQNFPDTGFGEHLGGMCMLLSLRGDLIGEAIAQVHVTNNQLPLFVKCQCGAALFDKLCIDTRALNLVSKRLTRKGAQAWKLAGPQLHSPANRHMWVEAGIILHDLGHADLRNHGWIR